MSISVVKAGVSTDNVLEPKMPEGLKSVFTAEEWKRFGIALKNGLDEALTKELLEQNKKDLHLMFKVLPFRTLGIVVACFGVCFLIVHSSEKTGRTPVAVLALLIIVFLIMRRNRRQLMELSGRMREVKQAEEVVGQRILQAATRDYAPHAATKGISPVFIYRAGMRTLMANETEYSRSCVEILLKPVDASYHPPVETV